VDKRGPYLAKHTEIGWLARLPLVDVAVNPTSCIVGTTDQSLRVADDERAQQQENPAVGDCTGNKHGPIADSNPTG
jgi:hypothetical protein